MNKEFVEYNEALALKELGFNEPCFYKFHKGGFQINSLSDGQNYNDGSFGVNLISAPLYQQAFRWFREKYNIRQNIMDFIDDETGIEWDYEIAMIGTDLDEKGNYKPLVAYSTDDETRKFKTYEAAELECLKKLIEIVKNGK
jgi:hypothetical protein